MLFNNILYNIVILFKQKYYAYWYLHLSQNLNLNKWDCCLISCNGFTKWFCYIKTLFDRVLPDYNFKKNLKAT